MTQTKLHAPLVITGHTNADFDALAAMVAASKLHPGAVLVFPGSQERTLRNFFIQSAVYLFNFKNPKDIDPASVQTLVLVDSRQRSRFPHVKAVLDRFDAPGGKEAVDIHVYDHHPDAADPEDDIPFSTGRVEPLGATTTIICRILRQQGVTVEPDEATLLGLGIYEDTGSFTFPSTTPEDLEIAAWLKRQGMDLSVVGELLQRELTVEQVKVLGTLLESAVTHEINGVPVVMAEVSLESYLGDFAILAHKLLDMENIRVLFALGRMQDRVHVVARSRTPDVDVGLICSSLGGGGHAYAASATVKDKTIVQVKDELFALLFSHINPHILAMHIMSKPPVAVEATQPINDAVDIMTRYGFKALPVAAPGSLMCEGVLDHSTADKAQSHGLGHIPVSEYMQRDCAVVTPHADLYPVMEIIVGQRQRLAPVVEDGEMVGVITRTDLINTLIEEPARIPEMLLPEKSRERNVSALFHEQLPKPVLGLLEDAGRLGEELGVPVYAVGGFVRDLLLKTPTLDIDLVVEGDGPSFARAFAARHQGRVREHSKFKTAVVVLPRFLARPDQPPREQKVDVATARLEYYEYPAALPTVELSSIKMDLYRRDFTINALAVELNPASFGRLVDFFGSQRDIKDRVIRVLHSLSFVEDPTRMLRAVRFSQRYGFRIGKQTLRLIKNALQLNLLDRLSGHRIFNELKLILNEEEFLQDLEMMQELGILKAIHPKLEMTQHRKELLEELDKILTWYGLLYQNPTPRRWLLCLLGMAATWKEEELQALTARLGLSKKDERELVTLRRSVHKAMDQLKRWCAGEKSLSELYGIMHQTPLEGALLLMAKFDDDCIKKHLSLYLTTLRGIQLHMTGEHLMDMGLPPGPIYTRILDSIRAAKLDGRAPSLAAELALAETLVRQHWDSQKQQPAS